MKNLICKKQNKISSAASILLGFVIILSGCMSAASAPSSQSAEGEPEFQKTVVSLTFDDGDADNYVVREDLSRNNLHGTFYVVSSFIGTAGYMTESQLGDLFRDGNEIGGHSLSHGHLPNLPSSQLREQVCQDRLNLLALGFEAVSFAYPGGEINDEVKKTVEDCGYNNGRIRGGGSENIPPTDVYALRPMPYVVQDTTVSKMERYIKGVEQSGGGWVIFTFHHVCDKCDYYSISPDRFSRFADWLGEQQANGLKVKTVGEVVGGQVQPGVAP
jgi:peptidoglycan/xylan/chitin deacetylase (PgdA/CDA1 family)